jgi:hypothetical protein
MVRRAAVGAAKPSSSWAALPGAHAIGGGAAMNTQVRFNSMYETPGKRDQETFLAQYDPLQVLGLPHDCASMAEVDDAFSKIKEAQATGKIQNPKAMKRYEQAHEILHDTTSPYYLKARLQDTNRQYLLMSAMPKNSYYLIIIQMAIYVFVGICGTTGVFYALLLPVSRMNRAASR